MEITMQRHTPHSRGYRSDKERHRIGTAAQSHAHKSIGREAEAAVEPGHRNLQRMFAIGSHICLNIRFADA